MSPALHGAMSRRTYECTDEQLSSMSERDLVRAVTRAYVIAEKVEALRGSEMFPDFAEHNELATRINRDVSRLSNEIVRRTTLPWEPRPWGIRGPRADCFAWVVWPDADACWERLVWRDEDEGEVGGYYLDADTIVTYGQEGNITHWLPVPPAPGGAP